MRWRIVEILYCRDDFNLYSNIEPANRPSKHVNTIILKIIFIQAPFLKIKKRIVESCLQGS